MNKTEDPRNQGAALEQDPGIRGEEEGGKGPRILEAAMETFCSKPYHQVKVEEIAALAGVGKGTVYEYYRSKEDLFRAVFDEGARLYFLEMEKALRGGGTAAEKFNRLVSNHVTFICQNRHRAVLMASEQRFLGPREMQQAFLERRGRLINLLRQTLRQGIREGTFRPQDVDFTSLFIMGVIISLWPLALMEEQDLLHNREQEVTALILNGLISGSGPKYK